MDSMSASELIDRLERYLSCALAREPAAIRAADDVKCTQNGEAIAFGSGVLQSTHAIGFRQYTIDEREQQAGVFATLDTSSGPALLSLRMKCERGGVSELEVLVPRRGDHAFFAPERLLEPLPIYQQALTPEQRTPRAAMIAAASRYFDAIEHADGRMAPCHPSCNRRENGIETTRTPPHFPLDCRASIDRFTHIERVRNRRFPIVDEARGLVWAQVIFDMPSQRRSLRLAELFKIIGGEIHAIEAVMLNTSLGAESGWPMPVRSPH